MPDVWWTILGLVIMIGLWIGRDRWLAVVSRRHRSLRAVIVRQEGHIRANVIHGGGGYRIQAAAAGESIDIMVADHSLYQRLRPGETWQLYLAADRQGRWWLRTGSRR